VIFGNLVFIYDYRFLIFGNHFLFLTILFFNFPFFLLFVRFLPILFRPFAFTFLLPLLPKAAYFRPTDQNFGSHFFVPPNTCHSILCDGLVGNLEFIWPVLSRIFTFVSAPLPWGADSRIYAAPYFLASI
jgi:hypothetical protein